MRSSGLKYYKEGMRRGCTGKIRYRTRKAAHMAAKKYTEKYGDHMRAYHCPYCDNWHLTRKPLS